MFPQCIKLYIVSQSFEDIKHFMLNKNEHGMSIFIKSKMLAKYDRSCLYISYIVLSS